jgi:GMP synthase (glutamine-hydrolysing)
MKPVVILQNCAVEGPGTIIDYLDEHETPYQIIHTYMNETLPEVAETGAVINLGCPVSIRHMKDHPFLGPVFQLVTEALRHDLPYLGICFGGQMLAVALGAQVERNKVKEIGADTVRLTEEGRSDALFAGFDVETPVFQWHGDTFRVPFGSALLAEGERCRNQAFRKNNAVALQFHLEATPRDVSQWCDAYTGELFETGHSKEDIRAGYEKQFDRVKKLNFRLLDNFFALYA